MSDARTSDTVRAALWMVITLASFSGMAVAARELKADLGTFEVLFFRTLVAVLILLPFAFRNGGAALRTRRPMLHLARNSVHFFAQYCWVVALAVLPLAEAFALEFTMPIWVTLLAVLFLGERMTGPRFVAVIGGMIGVVIVLRPGIGVFNPDAFYMLAAALAFAGSIVMVKALVRTDSPLTTVVYMNLIQLPMGLVPALFEWVPPSWSHVPWFIVIGIGALTAHYSLAKALSLADATIVLPIDFLRVPLIAIVGMLLYDEALVVWVFVGAAVIFGANYYAVWKESRTQP